jgi:hypothetical protein
VIAAAPPPLIVHHGSIEFAIDVRFGLRLVQLGVDAYPVAPAIQDSLVFTLPVVSGRAGAHSGRLKGRGGFNMQNRETGGALKIADVAAKITRRRLTLSGFATAQGIPSTRFTFAHGRIGSSHRTKHSYVARRVGLAINGVSAAALNSQLRTNEFHAGQRFAVGTVKARG